MASALLIFIKNPALGRVKTRLAKTIGDTNALKIYHYLLQHTMEVSFDLEVDKYVYYTEFIPTKDEWPNAYYEKEIQQGAHLGEKMVNAFTKAINDDYKKIVMIQPDCPKMTDTLLEKSFKSLEEHDFVIGATEDGSVYLLGMKAQTDLLSIFEGTNYNNSTNFEFLHSQMEKTGKSIFKMQTLKDVDTEEDLGTLKKMIK